MALAATIFKADVQISDMDRGYYQQHALTMARHPSETNERLMVRLLAFMRHADEALAFTKGLSESDEPDLWRKDLTGAIDLWIEVGQPEPKRILQACGRARHVVVYSYGRSSDLWWKQSEGKLDRSKNLTVIGIPPAVSQLLADMAERTMQLQCMIQDDHVFLTAGDQSVQIDMQQTLLRSPQAA